MTKFKDTEESCVLAKIHMVTKLGVGSSFDESGCVLAKIHMVTKLLNESRI